MNLLDVFGKCNGINRLTYEDFKVLGWNCNDYFSYMSLCDEIRAAIMMCSYVKKIEGIKIIDHKKCEESLLKQRIQVLFDWLAQFNDGKMPTPYGAYAWMHIYIRYSWVAFYKGYGRKSEEPNPGLLYRPLYDFTVCIETYISKVLKGEDLLDWDSFMPQKITDMNASDLKKKIDSLKFEISNIREPVFPANLDNYIGVMRWAKEQVSYDELSDLEDELEECEERLKEIKPDTPVFHPSRNILYVYRFGNIICKKDKHPLINVNCNVEYAGQITTLNAQYCPHCDKFIISEKGYTDYIHDYRFLPLRLVNIGDDGFFPQSLYRTERADISPLGLAGYNVREKNGLTKEERQNLLTSLIDLGVMEKQEIINYLEMFIRTNGSKFGMYNAVRKWQSDLDFIREYNMEWQDEYNIDDVQRY